MNALYYKAKKITSWGKCGVSLNIILVKSILRSGRKKFCNYLCGGYYAAIDPDEGYCHIAFLKPGALNRFRKWITEFRKSEYRGNYDP